MSIDSKIVELFDVVQARKKEVEAAEASVKKSWKTNCSFSVPWQQQPINIQTAGVEILCHIAGYISTIQHGIALFELKTDAINGFPASDWVEDCKKRIAMIDIRAKKEELQNLEKRLNAIVSPEQRREMELQAIADALK